MATNNYLVVNARVIAVASVRKNLSIHFSSFPKEMSNIPGMFTCLRCGNKDPLMTCVLEKQCSKTGLSMGFRT